MVTLGYRPASPARIQRLESAKLGTVPYCELASRLVVPRQREADGQSSSMTDAQSCVFIMYRWSGSLTSKPPGVARMFRCSVFDTPNTWSEALGESFDVLKLWSEALGE